MVTGYLAVKEGTHERSIMIFFYGKAPILLTYMNYPLLSQMISYGAFWKDFEGHPAKCGKKCGIFQRNNEEKIMAYIRKMKSGNSIKWRAEIEKQGIRLSAVYPTMSEAQDWARDIEWKIQNGLMECSSQVSKTEMTVNQAFMKYKNEVSAFIKDKKSESNFIDRFAGYHVKTNKAVDRMLNNYEERENPIADMKLKNIDSHVIEKWMKDRLASGVKNATVNRELTILKKIFKYAVKNSWIKFNPTEYPEKVTKLSEPKKAITRRVYAEEIKVILEAWEYNDDIIVSDKKHYAAILWQICLETAMRVGEVAKMKWKDVQINQAYCIARDTKNGDDRVIPLTKRAILLFNKLPKNDEYISPLNADSLYQSFKKAAKKAGIHDMRWHDSRHEGITRLAGVCNMLELMKIVGHKKAEVTQRYYDKDPEQIAAEIYHNSDQLKPQPRFRAFGL